VSESGPGLKIQDDEGKTIGKTAPLVAWDAKVDDAGDPVATVPLSSTLTEVSERGDVSHQELALTAPEGFLEDVNTQYPVVIDPQLYSLPAAKDTYARSGDTTSRGGEPQLLVGKISGASSDAAARAFLKYGTGGLAGKQVISAELSLMQYYASDCNTGRTVNLYPITAAWGESFTWSNGMPTATSAYGGALNETAGASGCGTNFVHADITGMVQAWASGALANEGLRMSSINETTATYGRKFCSMNAYSAHNICNTTDRAPEINVTWNSTPNVPSMVTVAPVTTDGGVVVTTAKRPKFSVTLSDPDGGLVSGTVRITNAAGGIVADLSTASISSGGTVTKQATSDLPDGTYTVAAMAGDGYHSSAWGPAMTLKVDAAAPAVPTITCPSIGASGQWLTTRPLASTTCTVTSDGTAAEFVPTLNNQPLPAIRSTSSGNQSSASIDIKIPENGVVGLAVRARDSASNLSAAGEFGLGVGDGGVITPVDGERTSSTVLTQGEGPSGASSARLEHRGAGTDDPWIAATKVSVQGGSQVIGWLGTVSATNRNSVTTGNLIWDIASEPGIGKPSVRETRICFIYAGVSKCTPSRDVTVVPAAFGSSFPTQDVGPGQVALFTGEFQMSENDIEVPAYSGTISLGRSHRSYAGVTAPAQGVFGPGWIANLEGPGVGAGSYEVTDNTAQEASITLTSPDGKSSTYVHEDYTASPQLEGYYDGDVETGTENNVLEIVDGPTKKMILQEQDGTETTWAHAGSGKWVIEKINEPGVGESTTYTHSSDGLVTGIYAPTPAGVTCNTTSQTPGCRALWLTYTGTGSDKRLAQVDLRIWDPKPGTDGRPGPSAAMATVPVQKYAYNSNGTLKETWDPRMADGASALKTSYEYASIGNKTVVTQVTPPGQTPWRFDYATTGAGVGKFKTAKRAQVSPLTGDATWSVVYGTELSGTGLPDLTASATKTWGQTAAPVAAATVFGPAASGTGDASYGTISYWDVEGRTTNTATFGAGAWQVDSSAYDAKGNEIWALEEGNRNTALTGGGDTVATAHNLSTQKVYNVEAPGIPGGTRIEETTGPGRPVILKNGTSVEGRSRAVTVYDDEAAAESVPTPERPTQAAGAPALNLPVEERTSTITSGGAAYDIEKTRYRYDRVVASDGSGWALKSPTRTMKQLGSGWSTELTRFDNEGKVVEVRTPQGVAAVDGTANDARSTKTVYYTADTSAADAGCRQKPEWAGLTCLTTTGDPTVPATRAMGFDYLLNSTRTEQSASTSTSTMTRASVTAYDAAGRKTAHRLGVAGAPEGDLSIDETTFGYSPSMGVLTSVTRGSSTQSATYDVWGRVLTQTDGAGNTASTTYDAAGRIRTSNDGKGTYTYTYDGTDAAGNVERRGLVTKLDVGLASGASVFEVASNADGNAYLTKYPNGMTATSKYDALGTKTALTYVDSTGAQVAAFSDRVDAQSRVRLADSTGSRQAYTYDDRSRLTAVEDTTSGNCVTRRYGFSLDSNRTSLATSYSGTGGACTTAGAYTATSTFDAADRITDSGYVYDALGRTRVVSINHIPSGGGELGGLSVKYYSNDIVASLTQSFLNDNDDADTRSKSFTLDPIDRVSKTTSATSGVDNRRTTNHYADTEDSPAWIETETRGSSTGWVTSWTRNVAGPDGKLAIIEPETGGSKLQIANLHGDIVASVNNGPFSGISIWAESTEYGLAKNSSSLGQNYGWLGAEQRSTDTIGGLTLMGARLYNPITGRFLSRDPVWGGNDNTYVYPPDPVNEFDLDGREVTWLKNSNGRMVPMSEHIKRKINGYHNLGTSTLRKALRSSSVWESEDNHTVRRVRVIETKCAGLRGCWETGRSLVIRIIVSTRVHKSGPRKGKVVGIVSAYCEGYRPRCPNWVNNRSRV
jgi:RHS repeat-associated protein